MMSFEEIADGFMYFAIRICPDLPLEKAYEVFARLLTDRNIDPHYEDFLLIYLPAEAARSAPASEQTEILNALRIHPFFLNMTPNI